MILDDDRPVRGQYDPDPTDPETQAGGELEQLADDDDDGQSPRAFLRTLGLGADAVAAADRRRAAGPSPELVDLLSRSKSVGTRIAYRKDLAAFAIWLTDIYLDIDVPDQYRYDRIAYVAIAEPIDVAEYVEYLAKRHYAVATIKRRVAAISHAFKLLDKPPLATEPKIGEAVAAAARDLGTKQRQVEPLMLEQLRHIVRALPIVNPHAPAGRIRRDQLLLLLGWAGALRASELVALNVADLTFVDEPDSGTGGLIVHIGRSKTDQTAAGTDINIAYASTPSACPVRAALYHVRDIKTGPLFCNIDRHGRRRHRLGVDNVGRIIKRCLTETYNGTIDPRLYSSHSLRAGFVTEAANHGVPDRTIANTTRHTNLDVLRRYDRPENNFGTGALAGEWW